MKKLLRRKFFSKNKSDYNLPKLSSDMKFQVKIEDLLIGILSTKDGIWEFQYSENFKNQNKYHRLVGFSNLDKTYRSDELWPFFKLRIPGLKQPRVKEIIESEHLDVSNEALLLKRFGYKNASSPYTLEVVSN